MRPKIDWDWLISRIIIFCPPFILAGYVIRVFVEVLTGPVSKNDFVEFWVASSLAMAGESAAVYDLPRFYAELAKVVGTDFHTPWFYPPFFLLLVAPLSLLPYNVALILWLALPLGAYLAVMRCIAPHRLTLWLSLAFPGVLINLDYGQNALFSAALLGGGLLFLERSPVLAGIFFGILAYKPNLAVLIPVALIAGRYWRALASAVISCGVLILSSGLILGWDTWIGFWSLKHLPLQALDAGLASLKIMPSVLATARLAGGSPALAYLLQGLVMAGTLWAVIRVWLRDNPLAIRASVLTLATLLFSPYYSEYELARLALPIAWIGWEGYKNGWRPGEKAILIFAWFTPLICRLSAKMDFMQITPLVLIVFLFLLIFPSPVASLPQKDNS